MGNLSTKHLDTHSSYGKRIRHGILKLEYKKIVEFMGEIDEWQRCKPKTGCTFYGSGYEWLLTDATYAARNTQMKWVIYSHLAVETIGGTAHHPIKKHDGDKNGYGAWNVLCECYYGYAVKKK